MSVLKRSMFSLGKLHILEPLCCAIIRWIQSSRSLLTTSPVWLKPSDERSVIKKKSLCSLANIVNCSSLWRAWLMPSLTISRTEPLEARWYGS